MMARDAVLLISLATEEFVKRLSEAGQKVAERNQRTTVQQRDIGA
jgi:DNA polymerase epsilon subunit 4